MIEGPTTDPVSPGSMTEFARNRGYDTINGAVIAEYSKTLAAYRVELAAARGITSEELHHGPIQDVGRIATFSDEQPQVDSA